MKKNPAGNTFIRTSFNDFGSICLKIEKVSNEEKALFRPILNRGSIYDSMASYYLYEHPFSQIEIFGAFSGSRTPVGFLVRAQTGVDLFRPLLIPFVAQENVLNDLLLHVLTPERPVLLVLPLYQWEWIQLPVVLSNETRTEVFRLDPIAYQPVLNVLVQHQLSPSGWPRYEIRHQNLTIAAAGVNWAGERFVEVYLDLEETPGNLRLGNQFSPHSVRTSCRKARSLYCAWMISIPIDGLCWRRSDTSRLEHAL